jgi:DUF971 family protein
VESLVSADVSLKAAAIRSPRGARVTEIDWRDGHKSVYPHTVLRGYCPCAGCQGHTGEIHFREVTADAELELEDIEMVGGYALALKWFDGHSSGIYSFKYLRALCQCPVCQSPDRGVRPRL